MLILKSCIGNRALGWDLLPPGSERFEYEGKLYAGYGESPLSWEVGSEPVPIEWYAGKQYDTDVANAKEVLAHLEVLGAKELVIVGMQTHMCLEAATRAAYDLGFKVTVVGDACATRDLTYGDRTVPAADVHASTLATLNRAAASARHRETHRADGTRGSPPRARAPGRSPPPRGWPV